MTLFWGLYFAGLAGWFWLLIRGPGWGSGGSRRKHFERLEQRRKEMEDERYGQ